MLTSIALAYFDGSPKKLGELVGITSQAVSQFGKYVPERIAARLEKRTKGKLKYDVALYIHLEQEKFRSKRMAA